MRIQIRQLRHLHQVHLGIAIVTIKELDITYSHIVTLLITRVKTLVVYLLEQLSSLLIVTLVRDIACKHKLHIVAVWTCRITLQIVLHCRHNICIAKLHCTANFVILRPYNIVIVDNRIQLRAKSLKSHSSLTPTITLKHSIDIIYTLSLLKSLSSSRSN